MRWEIEKNSANGKVENDNQIYILTVAAPLAFQGVQTKLRDMVMEKKNIKKGVSSLLLIETLPKVIR